MTSKFKLPNSTDEFYAFVDNIVQGPAGDAHRERAAIYTRVSRLDKTHASYSMEVQPDSSDEYARGKGWEVVRVYADPDESGRNSRRPEFQRLIQDIKAGRINIVVVHRLDRIYRNLESLLRYLRFLKKYKVRLVSVTEQIDTESPWGRLVIYVLGALAEMWVLYTSERIKEVKSERARNGLTNGHLSFGYCNGLCSNCTDPNGPGYCPLVGGPDRGDGRVAVPHPLDKYAVHYMAHLYRSGWSDQDIAHQLNTTEFLTPDGHKVRFRPRNHKR